MGVLSAANRDWVVRAKLYKVDVWTSLISVSGRSLATSPCVLGCEFTVFGE